MHVCVRALFRVSGKSSVRTMCQSPLVAVYFESVVAFAYYVDFHSLARSLALPQSSRGTFVTSSATRFTRTSFTKSYRSLARGSSRARIAESISSRDARDRQSRRYARRDLNLPSIRLHCFRNDTVENCASGDTSDTRDAVETPFKAVDAFYDYFSARIPIFPFSFSRGRFSRFTRTNDIRVASFGAPVISRRRRRRRQCVKVVGPLCQPDEFAYVARSMRARTYTCTHG